MSEKYELYHFGIHGMKWGIRRWQNEDGTFNEAGYERYFGGHKRRNAKAEVDSKKVYRDMKTRYKASEDRKRGEVQKWKKNAESAVHKSKATKKDIDSYRAEMIKRGKNSDFYKKASDEEIAADIERRQKIKRAIITGAVTVGAAAAVYAAYKSGLLNRIASYSDDSLGIAGGSLGKPGGLNRLKSLLGKASKESLDDIEVVLDESTVLHRMHGYENFDLADMKGKPLYATYKKGDVEIYKAFLSDWSGTGKRYDVSLGVKNKLKIPTASKAKQIIMDLAEKDKDFIPDLAKKLSEKELGFVSQEAIDYYIDELKNSGDYLFDKASYAMVSRGPAQQKTMQAFRDAGYNAVMDMFDKKGRMSDMPIIILDAENDLVKLGEQFVSSSDRIAAAEGVAANWKKMGISKDVAKSYDWNKSVEQLKISLDAQSKYAERVEEGRQIYKKEFGHDFSDVDLSDLGADIDAETMRLLDELEKLYA